MRILLLANSKKPGGRCLAGIDEAGNWVRPVSTSNGGAIPNAVALGDTPLRPLDIVEFEAIRVAPLPHQSENVLVAAESIRRVGVASANDPLLARASQSKAWFLADSSPKIAASHYAGNGTSPSLAYLSVPDFRILRRSGDYGVKWRGTFELGEVYADFALTDDLFTAALHASTEPAPAGLCISIGERFGEDDCHYKLVAGVVSLEN